MSAGPKPRVLVVEDDEDSREMLLAFLAAEGYHATGAESAEEGLAALDSGGFGLVITDHRLPGKTGSWMLEQATARGLLEQVGALLWSADPDPRCLLGVKILKKPIDLDHLLLAIEAALAAVPRQGLERRSMLPSEAAPKALPHDPIEIVLYVTDSVSSLRAVRNLESAMSHHEGTDIHLTICDLTQGPLAGAEDRVVFTPILIRRSPGPRESLLGDLRRPEDIHRLLQRRGTHEPGIMKAP